MSSVTSFIAAAPVRKNTHTSLARGPSNPPLFRAYTSVLAMAFLAVTCFANSARAATQIVDTIGDVTANDGKTTLREAIAAAQNGDSIEFAPVLFSSALPVRIRLSSAIVVSKNLMILGPGDDPTTRAPKLWLEPAPGTSTRLLQIQAPARVVISEIGFRGGTAAGGGAVLIDVNATANFQSCDFTSNQASSNNGGAILNRGTLDLDECLVSGNSAANGGGVASEGVLRIVRTLLEGNNATGSGGGIYSLGANLWLESSTLSANQAATSGGLAFIATSGGSKIATITSATFAYNTAAAQSGGLYVEGSSAIANVGGSLFAQNKIINKSGSETLHELGSTRSGKINSLDHNLFLKPGTTLSPWGPADIIGVDPLIGGLAYNGGRTRTHALASGSPAINRGIDTVPFPSLVNPPTDQRRFPRVWPVGGLSDIGAFEVGPPVMLALLGSPAITLPLGSAFTDPGVDFNAPAAATLTTSVNGLIGGQINSCCPGTYVIVYTGTLAGYSTSVSRIVNVTESVALSAPPKVTRFISLNGGLAAVNLAQIVTVSGLPASSPCALTYAVSVAPTGYNQTGLTSLPTISIGQVGRYDVIVTAFAGCGVEVGSVSFQLSIDPGNVVWPLAIDLASKLVSNGNTRTATLQQKLERAGESRWYKFQGKPGSRIEVTLTQLPANFDVVVYSDINRAYEELLGLINGTPEAKTLALLGAEFAPEAYAPEAYSPEAYAPEAYAPEAYAPEAYAPEAYAPEAYAPEAYAPEAYAPEAYAPEAYAPEAYAPEAYAPEAYAPEAYASAQQRSLVGFSASPGTVGEGIRFNTYSRQGVFYIRVRGQNGVFAPDNAFTLGLKIDQDLCAGVNDFNVTPTLNVKPTDVLATLPFAPVSLMLWDSARIAGSAAEKAALVTSLTSFALRAKAAVVDVNADDRIRALNLQADNNPACPIAKNLVAEALRNLIQAYRTAAPTLADITLIGNDDVIPFFRTNDEALLANEANYFPPVQDTTQSQSALRYGQVLSQDRYGSSCQVILATGPYDLPEVPTGRLVESASEIASYLQRYQSLFDGTISTGGVLPAPKSAFVAGYDFLSDSALAMRNDFAAGLGGTGIVRTLIAPENDPPALGWTAAQFETAFLGARHDLAYLAAHFSTGRLLAADYSTRFRAAQVAASNQDFLYSLILSAGCHSGYNTVDPHAVALLSDQPDWAQAFARKGAIWISGTGYQYGDTDFIEYTERLLLDVARALRTAPTSAPAAVSVGQALVDAKRRYLANTPVMRGIHEKTLLQVVLYGLPMVKLNLPGSRLVAPVSSGSTAVVMDLPNVTAGPGLAKGLKTGTLPIVPNLTQEFRTLDVVGSNDTVVASFFRGSSGLVTTPGEPVRPLESVAIGRPEGLVRGVGLRRASYVDVGDFLPFTGAPATETRGVHGSFSTSVFYPIQPWNLNQMGAVCEGTTGTVFNAFPTQFVSAGSDPARGILRKYGRMEFTVFYCPATTEEALANPPAINVVASTVSPNAIAFSVETAAPASAGVHDVWITYTGLPGSPHYGRWESSPLTSPGSNGIGTWTGSFPLNGADAAKMRFIVQAANGFGAVAANTNFGRTFVPGTSTLDGIGQLNTPTTVTFQPAPAAGGFYRATIPLSAQLLGGGAPLAGKMIQFRLGPAIKSVITNSQGVATTNFLLNAQPGSYALEANFSGDATFQNVVASSPFTVTKMPTSLTFASGLVVTNLGSVVVTLKAVDGTPLKERTVVMIVDNGTTKSAVAEITDGAGQARLPVGLLPSTSAQSYQVSAYFAVPVPDPAGANLPPLVALSDSLYVGSTASTTVSVSASLGFKDEQAWVGYSDLTAAGATPSNPGLSRLEILGSVAGPSATFGPNSVLASPSSASLTARVNAQLSGKTIVSGLMTVRVQANDNRRWRGDAVINGQRVELNFDWDNSGGTGSYHIWVYPAAGTGPLYNALPAVLSCEVIVGVGTGEKPAGGTSAIGTPDKPWTQQNGTSRVRTK